MMDCFFSMAHWSLPRKIYHMWSITRLEWTDEHSEATTGYLALKRKSFGCLNTQMSQVAKTCGKCLIFFVGGGRAVQKIHALVHVCCFCVISVFDFVWLHHDCIMTASWLHPDSITALICVVQTLWGRKRWSTQLTQFAPNHRQHVYLQKLKAVSEDLIFQHS